MLTIKKFSFDEQPLAEKAFKIREEVFVIEQEVSREEEYDEYEKTSRHYLALDNEKPVATARWRETQDGVKLERFAVLKDYRGRGVGNEILKSVLQDVKPLNKKIYLHAQLHAVPFYEKNGFKKTGPMFSEANIDHYKMIY